MGCKNNLEKLSVVFVIYPVSRIISEVENNLVDRWLGSVEWECQKCGDILMDESDIVGTEGRLLSTQSTIQSSRHLCCGTYQSLRHR